jgi:hypothetical protein
MRVNSATTTSIIALLVLSLTALGFAYFTPGGGHPTISAPASASVGESVSVSASSDKGGVRYVVTDEKGRVIHEQDTTEDPDGEGEDGSHADGTFTIPDNAKGPLTVTATDNAGQTSTQTITL